MLIILQNVDICQKYLKSTVYYKLLLLFQYYIIMKLIGLVLLTLTLALSSIKSQVIYASFDQYTLDFNKKYDTLQYEKRKKNYEQNIEQMKKIADFTPQLNNMTDWSAEEIQARKNLKMVNQNQRLARSPPLRSRLGKPLTLDWREKGVITSVKDQGVCGACWAFAVAAHAQSMLIIQNRFNRSIDLSQQLLLQCTPLSFCSGGYLQYAMAIGLNQAFQLSYPFNASKSYSQICNSKRLNIADYSNSYYNLTDSQIIDLLQQAPLPIAISSKNWQFYGNGILSCPEFSPVDHAVLLVGYTPQYWIVKNQWSSSWGIDGYIHITRNSQRNCRIGIAVHKMFGEGDKENDQQFLNLMKNSEQIQTTTMTNGQKATLVDKNIGFQLKFSVLLLLLFAFISTH